MSQFRWLISLPFLVISLAIVKRVVKILLLGFLPFFVLFLIWALAARHLLGRIIKFISESIIDDWLLFFLTIKSHFLNSHSSQGVHRCIGMHVRLFATIIVTVSRSLLLKLHLVLFSHLSHLLLILLLCSLQPINWILKLIINAFKVLIRILIYALTTLNGYLILVNWSSIRLFQLSLKAYKFIIFLK